jgi:hypothetical protein
MTEFMSDRAAANAADIPAINLGSETATWGPDWTTEDAYWQSAYPERLYARADRGYEYYRSAYRLGVDAAVRHRGREWSDVERDVRRAWNARAESEDQSWDDVSDAVRDAWDRVRGRSTDDRTHIR